MVSKFGISSRCMALDRLHKVERLACLFEVRLLRIFGLGSIYPPMSCFVYVLKLSAVPCVLGWCEATDPSKDAQCSKKVVALEKFIELVLRLISLLLC